MNRYRLILFLSLVGLVFLACSLPGIARQNLQNIRITIQAPTQPPAQAPAATRAPAPTTDPLASAKTCLANTWEITDISSSIMAAIPPEMAKQYNLQYTGTSGKGYYTLTQDGNVLMQADQMELQFTAKASIFDVPVKVNVDGEARGKYSLQGNTLTTSDMDTSRLTASAQALGQEMVSQEQIIQAIPLINSPHNTAEYSCSGDTLQLKLSSYPESVPPLVFHKVK